MSKRKFKKGAQVLRARLVHREREDFSQELVYELES